MRLLASLALLLSVSVGASHIHPTEGEGRKCFGGVFHSSPDSATVANPAPTVSAISPTSGSTAGGDAVTITGTGFLSGATAAIGGTTCTSPNVVSSTSLTCTTGARSAATVSVVVTNTDGLSGTGSNLYTYSAPFAPSDVSGLKVWLSDTISGSDGDAIASWPDLSGNGYHFGNTVADQKPTLKTNIKNGRQITRFDGAGDFLYTAVNSSNIISATAFSMWLVVNQKLVQSGSSTPGVWYGSNEGLISEKASATNICTFKNAGVPKFGIEHWGSTGGNVSLTIAQDTWYILHIRHESGNVYISVNNGTESSVADTGNTNPLNNIMHMGCNYAGSGPGGCGQTDFGEVLIYNTAVGSSDRTSIQSYLNSRWAIY